MTILSAVDPILITINELVTGPSRQIWLKSSSQSAETRKVCMLVYTLVNTIIYNFNYKRYVCSISYVHQNKCQTKIS